MEQAGSEVHNVARVHCARCVAGSARARAQVRAKREHERVRTRVCGAGALKQDFTLTVHDIVMSRL